MRWPFRPDRFTGEPSTSGRAWVGAAILAITAGCSSQPISPTTDDLPVVVSENETVPENALPGVTNWEMPPRATPPNSLAVYASPYDAAQGDTVRVFINSGSPSVVAHVYRMGWYGGTGARELRQDTIATLARQPACSPAFPGPVVCPWQETYRFVVGPDWRSGIYLLKLTTDNGIVAAYPFVVHSTGPTPDLTVVVPQFTWQAYNTFGGSSLYTTDPSTGASVPKVTFARPYVGILQRIALGGSDARSAVAFLERSGFSINYISDRELADPAIPYTPPVHGYVFLGHDEYWTWDEFSRVLALRNGGKHLAFLAGNNAYWNVRLGPEPTTGMSDGLITCYKDAARDLEATRRTEVTTNFHSDPLDRPENQLYGIMYLGSRHSSPAPDYFVYDGALVGIGSEILRGAGLTTGAPLNVALGVEGDGIAQNGHTPGNLQILLRTEYRGVNEPTYENDATFFLAQSGAGVFASGNNAWPGFLDGPFVNPQAQALTTYILQWMSSN